MVGTLIQDTSSEGMSQGDGRVIYLGTWKLNGNSIHVEYHLVSRTVPIEGEVIPGAPMSRDIQLRALHSCSRKIASYAIKTWTTISNPSWKVKSLLRENRTASRSQWHSMAISGATCRTSVGGVIKDL
jgi:hypothetical protein